MRVLALLAALLAASGSAAAWLPGMPPELASGEQAAPGWATARVRFDGASEVALMLRLVMTGGFAAAGLELEGPTRATMLLTMAGAEAGTLRAEVAGPVEWSLSPQGGSTSGDLTFILRLRCQACHAGEHRIGALAGGDVAAWSWGVAAASGASLSTASGAGAAAFRARDFATGAHAGVSHPSLATQASAARELTLGADAPPVVVFFPTGAEAGAMHAPDGVAVCPCGLTGAGPAGEHRFTLSGAAAEEAVLLFAATS